jgi:undecaprenyl-diphosphatase
MHTHHLPPRGYAALAGALLALLVSLGLYAWQVDHAGWEVSVVRGVQEDAPPGLRQISIGLTIAGHGVPWAGVMAALALGLWLLGSIRLVLMLAVVAAMQEIGALLKLLIERSRPPETSVEVWQQISSYSFPSGHVLGATLIFGFFFFAVEHCTLPVAAKRLLQALSVAWVLLMGLARMQLGAHWPSDVLGAYCLGALLLLPIVHMLRRPPAVAQPVAV